MNSKCSSPNLIQCTSTSKVDSSKVKNKSHKPIILLRRSSCGQITSKYGSSSKKEREKILLPVSQKHHFVHGIGTNFTLDCRDRPKSANGLIGKHSNTQVNTNFVSSATSLTDVKQECVNNFSDCPWILSNSVRNERSRSANSLPMSNIYTVNADVNENQNNANLSVVNFLSNGSTNYGNDNAFTPNYIPLQVLSNQQFVVNQLQLNNGSRPIAQQQPISKTEQFILPNPINFVQQALPLDSNFISDKKMCNFNSSFTLPRHSNSNREINVPVSMNPVGNVQLTDVKYFIDENNNIHTTTSDQSVSVISHPNIHPDVDFRFVSPQMPEKVSEKQIKPNKQQIEDDSLTNITWLGRMGVNSIMPIPIEKDKNSSLNSQKLDRRGRPPYSYMALIQFAINSAAQKRMTLRQVYQWIEDKFPYFKTAKPGWKNSIRHNLSLHDIFVREVASGSKSSYWTLRSDLNQRPLTLDSLTGSTQHTFDTESFVNQPTVPGQKPILPRLTNQHSYVVFPFMSKDQSSKQTLNDIFTRNETPKCSSNQLQDSGFYSDISRPSLLHNSSKSSIENTSGYFMHNDSDIENPMLSQANTNKHVNRKRSRKEPLKLLNDSFDSSLHFKLDFSSSSSKYTSPVFKLKSKANFKDITQSIPQTPKSLGLSEESFSDIINDLGSPFQTFFKPCGTQGVSPLEHCNLLGNSVTPISRHKRARKQCISVLTSPKSHQANNLQMRARDIENIDPSLSLTPRSKKSLQDTFGSPGKKSTPFSTRKQMKIPIRTPVKSDSLPGTSLNNDFMNEFILSVFKTPERSCLVNCSKTESPSRGALKDEKPIHSTHPQDSNTILPSIFGNGESTALNTSFSKLLDLSGVSFLGGSMGSGNNYGDLADDENVSWSHLAGFVD